MKTEVIFDLGFRYKKGEKGEKLTTATASARRGKQRRQGTVFVEAEEKSDDDRQAASVKDARAERAVFRAKNKQSNKNPKGYVSLGATIHKNLLFSAGRMYFLLVFCNGILRFFSFYYIIFLGVGICV